MNEAHQFANTVNRYGGDIQITERLASVSGAIPISPFADLNNEDVAEVLGQYLHAKGLDKRDGDK